MKQHLSCKTISVFYIATGLFATTLLRCRAQCTLCMDGSAPTRPDLLIHLPPNPASSCAEMAIFTPLLIADAETERCKLLQRASGICGCPTIRDGCHLCPHGSLIHPNNTFTQLPQFGEIVEGVTYTCQLMEALLNGTEKDDPFCDNVQGNAAKPCGCPNATQSGDAVPFFENLEDELWFGFQGAKEEKDNLRLYTATRISSGLSIFGALLVLHDCFRFLQRRKHVYNQIVGTMACFDILYSVSIALQQIPRPSGTITSAAGSKGNEATCKAQGWFIQWSGMSSLFLNGALSTCKYAGAESIATKLSLNQHIRLRSGDSAQRETNSPQEVQEVANRYSSGCCMCSCFCQSELHLPKRSRFVQ